MTPPAHLSSHHGPLPLQYAQPASAPNFDDFGNAGNAGNAGNSGNSGNSGGSASSSHTKRFQPYFTPGQIERLSAKQRGKLSVSREERGRQQACGFIDAVGVRCGFPRRTIATAQSLYMRFHLFFPYKDFNYVEVSLSTLYVSSKLHDTLKKPREIVLASYPVRFPHLVRKGALDAAAAEANGLEHDRKQVLSIERLVLETMCFSFKVGVEVGLKGVVKLGKKLNMDKTACQHAWRVAVDCYRTHAPLSYPPHIIALGSIYTSSLLLLESTKPSHDPLSRSDEGRNSVPGDSDGDSEGGSSTPAGIARTLGGSGSWEEEFAASANLVDDVAHALIDLYSTILSLPSETSNPNPNIHTPSPVSPREPQPQPPHSRSSSKPNASSSVCGSIAFAPPAYWTVQTLTELKIHLRERRPAKEREGTAMAWPAGAALGIALGTSEGAGTGTRAGVDQDIEGMGRNDATVRFLWDTAVA